MLPGQGEQTDLRGTVGWGRVEEKGNVIYLWGRKGVTAVARATVTYCQWETFRKRGREKGWEDPPPPPSPSNQTHQLKGLDGEKSSDWQDGSQRRCKSNCYTAARAGKRDAWEILLNSFSGRGHFLFMRGFGKPHWSSMCQNIGWQLLKAT